MGNASSVPPASVEFLSQIAGGQPIPLQDPTWKSLVAFPTSLASYDPMDVQGHIRPHTASLVYHNSQTLNCQRLLYLLCQQLDQISPDAASIATANAVHVARTILKDLIEQLNAAQLLAFIELPPQVLTGELGTELQEEFADLTVDEQTKSAKSGSGSLLERLARIPGAYLFQTEIIQLLLVMASTQLYTPQGTPATASSSQHVFLEVLVAQKILAGPTVQSLLLHFITSPTPPSGLSFYTPTTPRGALHFVKSAASSVIWLPYSAYSLIARRRSSSNRDGPGINSPLGDAAISLLLALHFYPPSNTKQENPFNRALRNIQDTDDVASTDSAAEAVEGGHGAGAATSAAANVPYAALFDSLGCSLLHKEASILLLYALIHGTPHFNNYCMARSDVDTLILPILELLYTARGRSANQLYMILIILLVVSQETAFASNIHRIPLRAVPFYKERPLVDTTLGSLLIVLLLRMAHYNLTALKDVYLHTNCLATMANLAPSMTNLSAHTSQRLVHLLRLLQKRHLKLLEGGKHDQEIFSESGKDALSSSSSIVEREQRVLELQLYSDFIRIVLEIINAILVNGLSQNPELVYALLHRREVFEPFEKDSKYTDLMENILLVVDHFGRKVDAMVSNENGNVSAEIVLQVIKTTSIGWRKEKLRTFPELRFSYEEEASPEDFFVPYVWSLILSNLSIPWTLSAITAFVPVMPKEESFLQGKSFPEQPQGGSGGGAAGSEIEMHSHTAAEKSSDAV